MRNIGKSDIAVSELSLGSWHTYSRLSFEANVNLINHAFQRGVRFFDVAYYRDKPHTEVLFGRMLQEADFGRDDIVLGEKVWYFDYPERSLTAQLDASLRRLAVENVDLIIVEHPRPEMDVERLARDAAGAGDVGPRPGLGRAQLAPRAHSAGTRVLHRRGAAHA
ncbi:aldo/keto reductase [Microbacterium sp. KUDC0406]|uniref:aldo/keto reductase n=1 Tax=Microbacterium sp. KUDC0406 TaxID=2909588 RepID=UPI0022A74FA3|nr:aldo/keto reductase [Microbacterium sp. KUDC0406]